MRKPAFFIVLFASLLITLRAGPGTSRPAAAEALPDLVPYTRPGFEFQVVPSAVKNTTQTSPTLYLGKPTYFDWSYLNAGDGPAPAGYAARIWVDAELALNHVGAGLDPGDDDWGVDWPYTVVTPGWHTLRFELDPTGIVAESNEQNNVWEARFYWSPQAEWWIEYFNNETLDGDPVLVQSDTYVDLSAGGSPGPGVNADHFSVRWTRNINLAGGVHRFSLWRDDGMRLWIDGVLALDEWQPGTGQHVVVRTFAEGTHHLRLEMFDAEGPARAKLDRVRCYSLATASNPAAGGSVGASPAPNCGDQWYVAGATVSLTAAPSAGYAFNGWSGSTTGNQNPKTLTMDADKSVTAKFIPSGACYVLSLDREGSGAVPVASPDRSPGCAAGAYHAGAIIGLTASAAGGWYISGWLGTDSDASTANTNFVTMPSGNHTALVRYARLLTLGIIKVGQGSVTREPDRTGYRPGDDITLMATPAADWNFAGWSGSLSGQENPIAFKIVADMNVTATFEPGRPDCYPLDRTNTGNGLPPTASPTRSTNCPDGQYVAGQLIVVRARPGDGWQVASWEGTTNDEATTLDNTVIMPPQRHEVVANYREWPVFIAFSPLVTADPCFGGPNEKEENDTMEQADAQGPVCRDASITGLPNDTSDYYAIRISAAGRLEVEVRGLTGTRPNLQLFRGRELVDWLAAPPYKLNIAVQPGLYYALVLVRGGNSSIPYTITFRQP